MACFHESFHTTIWLFTHEHLAVSMYLGGSSTRHAVPDKKREYKLGVVIVYSFKPCETGFKVIIKFIQREIEGVMIFKYN